MTAVATRPHLGPTLTQDRIEWHMWNWEQWMHRKTREGYEPGTASGFGNLETFDTDSQRGFELYCINSAKAVQAIIEGFSLRLKLAVNVQHGLVAAVFRLPGGHAAAYEEACALVGSQLAKRGIS